jgi:hypothetical protein
MRLKKVLLLLLNFFLNFFFSLSGMEREQEPKKTILFDIKPTSNDDQRLNPTFLSGFQLVSILKWNAQRLSIYQDSIANQDKEDTKKFLALINRLAKINDDENKQQMKIKNMISSQYNDQKKILQDKEAYFLNNQKYLQDNDQKNKIGNLSTRSWADRQEFFSFEDSKSEFSQKAKEEYFEKEGEAKKKERGFLGKQFISEKTEDNLNKVLQDIGTLLEAINQKGIEGLDKKVSALLNKLTETMDVVNSDILLELKGCLEEIKHLASGVNQTQAELIHKTIPKSLQKIDNILMERLNQIDSIAKKHIDSLNENFLVNKLKSLNPKNITIAIATLASIYPFWSIFRFYLNNEELKADHISKEWLWTRAGLTIFFPLIIGYLCEIIISANSNLSDFIQYNFLFLENHKNSHNNIKRILSFEALLLLISFVLLYKNFDWIQKHTILPEIILSYAFFMYRMIGDPASNWKRHCGVFFCLYAMLVMYKLYQAPIRDINLLKGYTHKIFYKNILLNILALLKWNSRILITGVAPFGLHAFLNFLRDKINAYIEEQLQEYENLLKEYNFADWSNTHNKKYQSEIKSANNREKLKNLEPLPEEVIESMSKEGIIKKIIEEYSINIKVGDSEEFQWKNEDCARVEVLKKLQNAGLIYYYKKELEHKKEILSRKTIEEYGEEIERLKKKLHSEVLFVESV